MAFLYKVEFAVRMTAEAYPTPLDIDSRTGQPVPNNQYVLLDTPDHAHGSRKVAGWYSGGTADAYRRGVTSALVLAASAHPADILVPLTNNVPLAAGESFHVLSVKQIAEGTEGPSVLGAAAPSIFVSEFQIHLPNPGAGQVDIYRKPIRKALVAAATQQGVAAVLNANIALAGGEVLDVLSVRQYVEGSNGVVWS
jgi:hypothetical protein